MEGDASNHKTHSGISDTAKTALVNRPPVVSPSGSARMERAQLDTLHPGGVLYYDFRSAVAKKDRLPETLRVIQWNIERGTQFERIVQNLRALRADILILQELDINCRRSGYRNVPRELAEALHMQIYFVCEFEEFDDPKRRAEHAVGPLSSPAESKEEQAQHQGRRFHGNAILSARADLSDVHVIPHTANMNWEVNDLKLCEPRKGFRSVLRCCIHSSQRTGGHIKNLYVYCCHFEIFCGTLMRVRQLLDVFRDATALRGKSEQCAFIIGGDFNTMADGIVRLARRYGTDRMRVLSFGEKEACWLQRKVLSRRMDRVTRGCCVFSYRFPYYIMSILYDRICGSEWVWRLLYGFSAEEVKALDNTRLRFYDPGDKGLSVTLDNPAYGGFVWGKLDWLLLSNILVSRPELALTEQYGVEELLECGSIKQETVTCLQERLMPSDGYVLFNEKFDASDHKGLFMHVTQTTKGSYPEYGAVYTHSLVQLGFFTLTRIAPLAIAWMAYKRYSSNRR